MSTEQPDLNTAITTAEGSIKAYQDSTLIVQNDQVAIDAQQAKLDTLVTAKTADIALQSAVKDKAKSDIDVMIAAAQAFKDSLG